MAGKKKKGGNNSNGNESGNNPTDSSEDEALAVQEGSVDTDATTEDEALAVQEGTVEPDPTTEDAPAPAAEEVPAMPEPPKQVAAAKPAAAAPALPLKKAPPAMSSISDSADDDADALQSVGMFIGGEADYVDIDSIPLPPELAEPSFKQVSENITSWVIFFLVTACMIGSALYINNTQELRIQIEYLFEGGLERHKRAHILELRERYQKEDHYAQNRYGEFRMIYSPRDAEVEVTLIKYREGIQEFMSRYVRGLADKRVKIEERELKKFKQLTSNLKERQVVAEQNIKNLPVTSRTNPKDKENPNRPRACTDSAEDYCTFVYKVKISKEKYRPREFLIFSEYSLDPPGFEDVDKKIQQLLYKNTGPNIFEVNWPGADLQPTPELFQEQFIRVMTSRLKCKLGPEDWKPLELKNFRALLELPEDERWQKLADNGLLSHGPPNAKVWTMMEWKASVAELKQHPVLWTTAEQKINDCKCEEGVKCWVSETPAAPAAP